MITPQEFKELIEMRASVIPPIPSMATNLIHYKGQPLYYCSSCNLYYLETEIKKIPYSSKSVYEFTNKKLYCPKEHEL